MPAIEDKPKTANGFKPFTLIFDDGSNGTMILPAVNGYKLRMRWLRSNLLNRRDRKGEVIGRDLGKLSSMPDIPGVELTVKPHASRAGWITCQIRDPLEDQPETLQRISSALSKASIIGSDAKRKAVAPMSFDLDADMGKTFLIALRNLVDSETAHEWKNTVCPTWDQINGLSGDEVYDPVNPIQKTRKYVKDVGN
jgi:hypothetical protein